MRRFLLSENTKFYFEAFGLQHIVTLFLILFGIILIFVFRKKIQRIKPSTEKKLRIIFAILLIFNMLFYRFIYMYYGIYDIKYHLSLYYCHITNYLFALALLIDYKPF